MQMRCCHIYCCSVHNHSYGNTGSVTNDHFVVHIKVSERALSSVLCCVASGL